uniref:Uncharacterized protein n=1 Tax=Rhizophora mucronata TaxID=61149 RepID=A0A2P2N967_RHIMU
MKLKFLIQWNFELCSYLMTQYMNVFKILGFQNFGTQYLFWCHP